MIIDYETFKAYKLKRLMRQMQQCINNLLIIEMRLTLEEAKKGGLYETEYK